MVQACCFDVESVYVTRNSALEIAINLAGMATCDQKQIYPPESSESQLLSFDLSIKYIAHASNCGETNCRKPGCQKMKRIIQHAQSCEQKTECPTCRHYQAVCYYHAESCRFGYCPVSNCSAIRKEKGRYRQSCADQIFMRSNANIQNQGMSAAVLQTSPGNFNSSSQPLSGAQPHSSLHPPQTGTGMEPPTGPPVGALQDVQQVQAVAAIQTAPHMVAASLNCGKDLCNITKEPEFSQDYEESIPGVKEIVDSLFERLKVPHITEDPIEFKKIVLSVYQLKHAFLEKQLLRLKQEVPHITEDPIKFQKKLLSSVRQVREAFQEKFMQLLRLKHEYFSHGTAPNNFLEELDVILKLSGECLSKLTDQEIKQVGERLQNQPNLNHLKQIFQHVQHHPRLRMIFLNKSLLPPDVYPTTGSPGAYHGRVLPGAYRGRVLPGAYRGTMPPSNLKTYMTTAPTATNHNVITEVNDSSSTPDSTKTPIITEVEETSSKAAPSCNDKTTNHHSTVVIEEIS